MGRFRGGSGRGGGSGREIIPGRVRGRYSGRGKNVTYRKDKAKSSIYKSLGNSMFTYEENNSDDEV